MSKKNVQVISPKDFPPFLGFKDNEKQYLSKENLNDLEPLIFDLKREDLGYVSVPENLNLSRQNFNSIQDIIYHVTIWGLSHFKTQISDRQRIAIRFNTNEFEMSTKNIDRVNAAIYGLSKEPIRDSQNNEIFIADKIEYDKGVMTVYPSKLLIFQYTYHANKAFHDFLSKTTSTINFEKHEPQFKAGAVHILTHIFHSMPTVRELLKYDKGQIVHVVISRDNLELISLSDIEYSCSALMALKYLKDSLTAYYISSIFLQLETGPQTITAKINIHTFLKYFGLYNTEQINRFEAFRNQINESSFHIRGNNVYFNLPLIFKPTN